MKTIWTIIFLTFFQVLTFAQNIISVVPTNSFSALQLSLMFNGLGGNYGVDVYKVIYTTTDPNGGMTVASGALYVPQGCDSLPTVVYQHGTVLGRTEVPSQGGEPVGLFFASDGYLSVAPDYLGLGDSPGLHPYLHSETEATAALNLLRASRIYVTDSLNLHFNGEVFITGYSQGGHAAMALHEYIEKQGLLLEFNVIGSAPLSGPYNLSGVQTALPADSSYSNPAYLPYIVSSYQFVYGNLYNAPSDYYKPPYDVLIPPYFDGTHSIGELNAVLPNNIFEFMQDSVLNAFIADTINFSHPLRVALSLNDNYDWTPTRPVRMCYCTGDEQVYYQNSLVAAAAMNTNGATDVQAVLIAPNFNHGTCFFPALLYTHNWFNSLHTGCILPVSTKPAKRTEIADINVYPNPSNGQFWVDLSKVPAGNEPLEMNVFDLNGRLLRSQKLYRNAHVQEVDWTYLPQGVYFLTFYNGEILIQKKLIIN